MSDEQSKNGKHNKVKEGYIDYLREGVLAGRSHSQGH